MERQIGETFGFSEVTLEVVENSSCVGCYFFKSDIYCDGYKNETVGDCGADGRSDGKSVIFKKVE